VGESRRKLVSRSRQYQCSSSKVKNKTISVTGCGDLQSCEMLWIPYCLDNGLTDSGKVVSLMRRPRSTPQKHYFSASGTHFC
jgi:hypothetical protein